MSVEKTDADESSSQKSSRRVVLTKAEVASEHGRRIVDSLLKIVEDDGIDGKEIFTLYAELKTLPQEIAGVRHLVATIEEIMEDGVVDPDESDLLWRQFERVLPPDVRDTLVEKRKVIARKEREEKRGRREEERRKEAESEERRSRERWARERRDMTWYDDDATGAQKCFIADLGGVLPPGASKGEAAELIDSLLASGASPKSARPTPRQQMVLRFWAKEGERDWTKKGVSEWMDGWYAEDPQRLVVWEAYKEAKGDFGQKDNPDEVATGYGLTLLSRLKSTGSIIPPDSVPNVGVAPVLNPSLPAGMEKKSESMGGCGGCLIVFSVLGLLSAASSALGFLGHNDSNWKEGLLVWSVALGAGCAMIWSARSKDNKR